MAPALAPDLPPVLADPGQIEQILLQLATYAREAMPAGGRLELRTAAGRIDAALRRRATPACRRATTSCSRSRDTGAAWTPRAVEHIFDPFFADKPADQGLGLGLASVYGIVKQSGGYIAAESRPGAGTAFTIYLPRQESGAARRRTSMEFATLDGTETVLLVEDEEQVRELARRVLERSGYTVLAPSTRNRRSRSPTVTRATSICSSPISCCPG